MRPLVDMDTIQIEITNACQKSCSNCTRFCGHHKTPFFMTFKQFKQAVQSMKGYLQMVGIMGGEPLLHPQFAQFCKYIRHFFPKRQLGLWSSFPDGYEHYAKLIVNTFGHVFPNDHSRPDIYHHPLMVSAREVMVHEKEAYYLIDNCWVQNSWSASINPNGAFFCEVAAAWSTLLGGEGWPVEKEWWWRTPKDFTSQIEQYCLKCGGAMPLQRRSSNDRVDDISPNNYELLKDISPKIKRGHYKIHDLAVVKPQEQARMAAYKDSQFRDNIVRRYGIYLIVNDQGFASPYLRDNGYKKPKPLFDLAREAYLADGGESNVQSTSSEAVGS